MCKFSTFSVNHQTFCPCPYFLQTTANQSDISIKNVPFDYFAQIPLNFPELKRHFIKNEPKILAQICPEAQRDKPG